MQKIIDKYFEAEHNFMSGDSFHRRTGDEADEYLNI